MFSTPKDHPRYAKSRQISDPSTGIYLELDTDDVDPDAVSEENVSRIVSALNREFHGAAADARHEVRDPTTYADAASAGYVHRPWP